MQFRFGSFVLDDARSELRRDGRMISCQKQTFDLLVCLVRHAGRNVPRSDLFRAVWPDQQVVSGASLDNAVRALRGLLGDDGRRQAVIKTVRGVGYRFLPEVVAVRSMASSTDLAEAADDATSVSCAGSPGHGVRRVTVLACDPGGAGPDFDAVFDALIEQVGGVARDSATVGSYVRFALFGIPRALGEDARRAADAGFALLDRLAARAHGAFSRARVALHSGDLELSHADAPCAFPEGVSEGDPSGHARCLVAVPNPEPKRALLERARALVAIGAPRTIVCSPEAREALAPRFRSEPLRGGAFVLEPQSASLDRLDAASHPTPLVNRLRERRVLRDAFDQAADGAGGIVWISGEAGVGKSRLARALARELEREDIAFVRVQCAPLHQHTELHPLLEVVRQQIRAHGGVDPLRALEAAVRARGGADRDVAALAHLLELRDLHATRDPDALRTDALRALSRLLLPRPDDVGVLFVDDLQWCDPATWRWLEELASGVSSRRLLVLLCARPESPCPWSGREEVTLLNVRPLSPAHARDLLRAVATAELPRDVEAAVLDRAGGVPLFVEELARSVSDAHARGREVELHVPASLRESIAARLDRIPVARRVAELASVIGPVFSHRRLAAICDLGEAALSSALRALFDANLMRKPGSFDTATYAFHHALVRDVAYESLVPDDRRAIHLAVAEDMEAEARGGEAAIVAHHFARAGAHGRALPHLVQAIRRATFLAAHDEALANVARARRWLAKLSEAERRAVALELELAAAAAHGAKDGYESRECERALREAHALAHARGADDLLCEALRGLVSCYSGRGEVAPSIDCARELHEVAARTHERAHMMLADLTLGMAHLWEGSWELSLDYSERALRLHDRSAHRRLGGRFVVEPAVTAELYAAFALWGTGRLDDAWARACAVVASTRCSEHVYSHANACAFAAVIALLLRDPARVREHGSEAVRLSEEHGFALFHALGRASLEWAEAVTRRPSKELAARWLEREAPGAPGGAGRPFFIAASAQAYLDWGDFVAALDLVAAGLDIVEARGERGIEPELMRIRGDALAASGAPTAAARAWVERAWAMAREQGAVTFELRAAVSLARLATSQRSSPSPESPCGPASFEQRARAIEAIEQALARVVGGARTPDLIGARELLHHCR